MCGRYALYALSETIWEGFDLEGPPRTLPARYNIAPTQEVLVVGLRAGASRPKPATMRWGLVPSFSDDLRVGSKMLNARVETFDSLPSFRAAAVSRRCLVVASGYYEWQGRGAARKPYFIAPEDGGLIAFAGLWESNRRVGAAPLYSCTVLTAPAEGPVATLHDRMPVVLPRALQRAWIDPRGARGAREVLSELAAPALRFREVPRLVNSVANEGPELLGP